MFAYIKGQISYLDPTLVILENQGLGYGLKISLQTYSVIKNLKETKIWVHKHISMQNDIEVYYGFHDLDEKNTFLQLISVSGVGANTAIMILSSLSPLELEKAIVSEDLKTIQSIKGIGLKTAQRMVLELKDKIKKSNPGLEISNISANSYNKIKEEALLALQTLGIPKANAEKNIDTVFKASGGSITLEELIKKALR